MDRMMCMCFLSMYDAYMHGHNLMYAYISVTEKNQNITIKCDLLCKKMSMS